MSHRMVKGDDEPTEPQPYRWRDQHEPELPLPLPKGWTLVPIRWLRGVVCIVFGSIVLSFNLYTWVDSREVSPELVLLGGGLLGLPAVLAIDDRRTGR